MLDGFAALTHVSRYLRRRLSLLFFQTFSQPPVLFPPLIPNAAVVVLSRGDSSWSDPQVIIQLGVLVVTVGAAVFAMLAYRAQAEQVGIMRSQNKSRERADGRAVLFELLKWLTEEREPLLYSQEWRETALAETSAQNLAASLSGALREHQAGERPVAAEILAVRLGGEVLKLLQQLVRAHEEIHVVRERLFEEVKQRMLLREKAKGFSEVTMGERIDLVIASDVDNLYEGRRLQRAAQEFFRLLGVLEALVAPLDTEWRLAFESLDSTSEEAHQALRQAEIDAETGPDHKLKLLRYMARQSMRKKE